MADLRFWEVDDASLPPNAVRSSIQDGKELIGRNTTMYSYPVEEDVFVSPSLQRGQWFDGSWKLDCNLFRHYHKGLAEPLNYLDIGANIGSIAVPMALCLNKNRPGAKVIAAEPLPEHVAMLHANFHANSIDNAIIWPYALGSEAREAPLRLYVNAQNKAHTTFLPQGELADIYEDSYNVTVSLSTIDDMYRVGKHDMLRVLMMKMDIEGAEGHALAGAHVFLNE